MHNLVLEQKEYPYNFRAFLSKENSVKLYTRNQSLELKDEATFDTQDENLSSIELFVFSFISSYIFCIKREAKKQNITLENVEISFTCKVQNPLTLLEVVGYEEDAFIKSIFIKVYIYSEDAAKKVEVLCEKALKNSLIYKLIDKEVKIVIDYRIVGGN
ncbi:MAG: OsmC family protein [Campylobacteraceae bacterium]